MDRTCTDHCTVWCWHPYHPPALCPHSLGTRRLLLSRGSGLATVLTKPLRTRQLKATLLEMCFLSFPSLGVLWVLDSLLSGDLLVRREGPSLWQP